MYGARIGVPTWGRGGECHSRGGGEGEGDGGWGGGGGRKELNNEN